MHYAWNTNDSEFHKISPIESLDEKKCLWDFLKGTDSAKRSIILVFCQIEFLSLMLLHVT